MTETEKKISKEHNDRVDRIKPEYLKIKGDFQICTDDYLDIALGEAFELGIKEGNREATASNRKYGLELLEKLEKKLARILEGIEGFDYDVQEHRNGLAEAIDVTSKLKAQVEKGEIV